jgi:Protein of unknown function (DUF2905)
LTQTPTEGRIRTERYNRTMQRILIGIGLLVTLIGVAWPWLSKLPLGRLPGDIIVDRPGFRFFMPLTTMIIVSVLLTLILWLWRK